MSFDARSWKQSIHDELEEQVISGLEKAGRNMQRLAKARAPVRKTRQRKARANRGGLKANFYDIESGAYVPKQEALKRIAAQQNRGAKVMAEIDKGDYSDFSGDGELRVKDLTWTSKRPGQSTVTKGFFLEVKMKRSERAQSRVYRTLVGTRPGEGAFFNVKTGRFQIGGNLRSKIMTDQDADSERKGVWSIRCVSYATYSRPVEYGRQKGKSGQTKPRPFMIPALMDTFEKIEQIMDLGGKR